MLDFPIALVDSEKTPDQHGNLRRDQKHFPGVSGRAQPNQLFAVQAPLPAISGCYPVLRIEIGTFASGMTARMTGAASAITSSGVR